MYCWFGSTILLFFFLYALFTLQLNHIESPSFYNLQFYDSSGSTIFIYGFVLDSWISIYFLSFPFLSWDSSFISLLSLWSFPMSVKPFFFSCQIQKLSNLQVNFYGFFSWLYILDFYVFHMSYNLNKNCRWFSIQKICSIRNFRKASSFGNAIPLGLWCFTCAFL